MGVESFFVHLVPAGVQTSSAPSGLTLTGASALSRRAVLRHLGATVLPNGRAALNGLLLATLREHEVADTGSPKVLSVVLEGCFACFAEAVEVMLAAAARLPGNQAASFYHPGGMDLPSTAREEFISATTRIYAAKRSAFRESFGDVHFLTLPDSQFYAEVKRRVGRG